VIIVGIPHLGRVDYFSMPQGFSGIFAAAALIFFAYIGFEEITRLGEETKDPEKTIPKALLFSIAISTVFYILVAIAAVSVIDWNILGESKAPLAEVVATALGSKAFLLISLIALFATANTALFMMVANSRIIYGMAVEKILPSKLGYILESRKTPLYAILITMIVTILFAIVEKIETVASLTDFALFLVFFTINLVVIIMRYKQPETVRPFKMPLNFGKLPVIALFGMLASLVMAFHIDTVMIVYGTLILAGLFLAYEAMKRCTFQF